MVRAADGPEETCTPPPLSLSLIFIDSLKHPSVHLFIEQTFTSPWWQALCWALGTLMDLNSPWGQAQEKILGGGDI